MDIQGIKAVIEVASEAGYNLKSDKIRNALMKSLSLNEVPLNELTKHHGRIIYRYCASQKGVEKDQLESVKAYGKVIAAMAVEHNISWEDAVEVHTSDMKQAAMEAAKEVGEKAVIKKG